MTVDHNQTELRGGVRDYQQSFSQVMQGLPISISSQWSCKSLLSNGGIMFGFEAL